ncbi:MAG: TetR/AcrR family transcriptional regulator [Chloroflexi bacterium]|nr:TetR/AcrR family transcriptional regulator [Chloroflexota bacterium]
MPKISPRARRTLTEERRKQILDAATRVFGAKGFERATIADIAHAAGIAEGSIYNYFKNKGDLLVSIPRQAVQPTIESLGAQMASLQDQPPEQMLTSFALNMLATIQQNVHIFRILLSALPTMSAATRQKYLDQVVMYAITTLESYFQEQIDRGIFQRHLVPSVLARSFIGMFITYIGLRDIAQLEKNATWTNDEIVGQVIPLFLRGALADSTKRKSK